MFPVCHFFSIIKGGVKNIFLKVKRIQKCQTTSKYNYKCVVRVRLDDNNITNNTLMQAKFRPCGFMQHLARKKNVTCSVDVI